MMSKAEKQSTDLFFSIVVPAYNVEQYLDYCVNSVLANRYQNYELIIIDDGSSDGTFEISEKWSSLDSRIKVIHQKNSGLSAARNVGINTSRGKYVVFLDSDDALLDSALENIASKCSKSEPDLIVTEMCNVEDISQAPNRDEIICRDTAFINKNDLLRYVLNEKPHTWSAPQYIVKRSFLINQALYFDEGYLHEDVSWTARLMSFADSYVSYPYPWYLRRYGRKGSITNTVSSRHILDTVAIVRIACEDIEHSRLTEPQVNLIRIRLAMSLFPSLRQFGLIQASDQSSVIQCIEDNLSLFALSPKFIHRCFVMACRLLGVRRALSLVALTSSRRK